MTRVEAAVALADRIVKQCHDLRIAPFDVKQYLDASVREQCDGTALTERHALLDKLAESVRWIRRSHMPVEPLTDQNRVGKAITNAGLTACDDALDVIAALRNEQ